MGSPIRAIIIEAVLIPIISLMIYKELISLPSPLKSFGILYDSNPSSIGLYTWIFLTFIFIPGVFSGIFLLWNLKFHFINPQDLQKYAKDLGLVYIEKILFSIVLSLTWLFFSLTDIVSYTFIRLSSLFPNNLISNMFFIILLISVFMFYFLIFLAIIFIMSLSIISKFAYRGKLINFCISNWPFLISLSGIVLFYGAQLVFIHMRINKLDVGFGMPASNILSKYMCGIFVIIVLKGF